MTRTELETYRLRDETDNPRKRVVRGVHEAQEWCLGGNLGTTKVAIFVERVDHASACIRRGGQSRVIQVSADTMRWSPMETVRQRLGLDPHVDR